MWVIDLPISIPYGVRKPKKFHLNLNVYRNAPFHQLDDMKKKFAEIVTPLLIDVPPLSKLRIGYYLFPGSLRECDVANICSIVDKFFCDTLKSAGKIEDDNYKLLPMVAYAFGEVDRNNPRVEAMIELID